MKKREYIKIYKSKLDTGQAMYKHQSRLDADGDPLYAVWPSWIGDTALSTGWMKVSILNPVAEKLEPPKFEEALENSMNVIEAEYTRHSFEITSGAKELADEHNLNIAMIPGTGRNGKITKFDVLKFLES